MAKYLNDTLWKSSYLIEFLTNGKLQEAFTFSVPPQQEEFIFPQRIAETKTFGGSVFEDYGNDTVKINLSGSTINQETKLIYKASKGKVYKNGEQEIFLLQKLLSDYGKFENLKNKVVYLYQLKNGTNVLTGSNKNWRIFTNELQIRRSKDMPFAYNYTLSCIGVPISTFSLADLLKLLGALNNKLSKLIEWIEKAKSLYDTVQNVINTVMAAIEIARELVSIIKNAIEKLESAIDSFYDAINGAIETMADIVTETMEISDITVRTIQKCSPQYFMTNVYNAASDVVEACNNFADWWKDFENGSQFQIIQSNYEASKQNYENNVNTFAVKTGLKDSMDIMISNALASSDALLTTVKSITNSEQPIVNPGANNGNDEILISYGYKEYKVTDSDTWASIAFDVYGDSGYAALLAMYNTKVETLEAGTKIYIPILSENSTSIEGNEIYNPFETKDNLGIDLKINSDGDFATTNNGDFSISSSNENINQSITNRLSTAISSRIRNVVYGIRTNVGDGDGVASSYVASSIEQTLLADPRIASVDELEWTGAGNNLNISFTYTTKNGDTNKYQGTL